MLKAANALARAIKFRREKELMKDMSCLVDIAFPFESGCAEVLERSKKNPQDANDES